MRIRAIHPILLFILSLAGCGGFRGAQGGGDPMDRLTAIRNKLYEKGILAEIGMSRSGDAEMAISQACASATKNICFSIEQKAAAMRKGAKQGVGSAVISEETHGYRINCSQMLYGVRSFETPVRRDGNQYEAFCLEVMDPKPFREILAAQAEGELAMRARYRTSAGQAELEREMRAYEQFKRENGYGEPDSSDRRPRPAP